MDLGLHLANFTWPGGPATFVDDLARTAKLAEDVGFTKLSVMDHVWQIGMVGPPEHEMLEAYTTLGYLAAVTERVELLAWVTAAVYREPGLLAKEVTTLDVLSQRPRLARHRRGVERGGVASGSACRSRPPPSASSASRRRCRSACRCGATARSRTPASTTSSAAPSTRRSRCSDRTRRSSSAAAARRRRCGWSRSTPRPATSSTAPTSRTSSTCCAGTATTLGRDYDEIEKTVMARLDPGAGRRERRRDPRRTCASSPPSASRTCRPACGRLVDRLPRALRRADHPRGGQALIQPQK